MEFKAQDNRNTTNNYAQVYVYNQKVSRTRKKTAAVKPFYWIAFAIATSLFAVSKFITPKPSVPIAVPVVAHSTSEKNQPIAGGLIVYADQQGHYRGNLQINGVDAPFLVDTGATLVVVPSSIASAAGLPQGRPVSVNTAGGQVVNYLTAIDNLKLGNAEIFNIPAAISPYSEEILIGMSALKYFTLQQNQKSMTLVTNHQNSANSIIPQDPGNSWSNAQRNMPAYTARPAPPAATAPVAEASSKAATSWKKSTQCDASGRCTTVYH